MSGPAGIFPPRLESANAQVRGGRRIRAAGNQERSPVSPSALVNPCSACCGYVDIERTQTTRRRLCQGTWITRKIHGDGDMDEADTANPTGRQGMKRLGDRV